MAEFTHRSFYRSRDRDRRAVLGSGTAQYTPDFSPGTSSEIAASHGYYAGSRGMHGIRTPPSSASPRLSARSRQGQPTFGSLDDDTVFDLSGDSTGVSISPVMRPHDVRLNRHEIDMSSPSPQTHHYHQTDDITLGGQPQVLSEILEKQNEMLHNMRRIMEEQKSMRHELDMLIKNRDSQSACSTTPKKRKKIVKRMLSERITKIHEVLSSSNQLKPEESLKSSHNKMAIETIVEEALKIEEFDKDVVTLAARRKYESLRRQAKSHDDEESCRKKAKYRQRKQRAFDRRKTVITRNEEQYFKQLSVEYMTEESDDEENGKVILLHKLTWRSEKVNAWMKELDKRYGRRMESKESVTPHKKRLIGTASTSKPPAGAPQWAVDPYLWSAETETQRPTADQDQLDLPEQSEADGNGETLETPVEFNLASCN